MTFNDLEQVIEIDQLSFSLPWPSRSFRFELVDNQASRCWVAELDGKVVGILIGWFIVDEIHIATFATHPDFRQRGIGKKLLSFALQSASDEGAVFSLLEVRESNAAALKMYRQFGYVEDGRRENYYSDNGEDAILMSLTPLTH